MPMYHWKAEFSHLPLHAATASRKGQKGVSDLYVSSYTTTLTALIHAQRPDSTGNATEKKRFSAIGQVASKNGSRLLSVGIELDNIGRSVDDVATTFTRVEGENACISTVADELDKSEWVHFACDSSLDQERPFESGLGLYDGQLTIQHIIQCKPQNPEFAYPSASSTTVGDKENPDEAMHLASAMQFAGFCFISGWTFDNLLITIQQRLCEALLAAGRMKEAHDSLLRMVDEIDITVSIETWVAEFNDRCRGKLEELGDSAMNAQQYDEAIAQYTTALSLDPPSPQDLLVKRSNAWVSKGAMKHALSDVKSWAKLTLMSGSWEDALVAAVGFTLERFIVYWAICEDLETTDRATDAIACFLQIFSEPELEIDAELAIWARNFKLRWYSKPEDIGDRAMNAKMYDAAVSQYTAALLLDPANPQDLFVKRSKAYVEQEKWGDALNDANQVINLDSSSPLGYERQHAALLGMGHYDEAIVAFETMLSRMSESSDPDVGERFRRHEQTRETIRANIKDTIRDSPSVLINTVSGRLCDRSEQAFAFEKTPTFMTIILSMTAHIDRPRIKQEVVEYFRYATFSHKWEYNEPRFEKVIRTVVYDLEASPAHEKLRMFCKIVREAGFNWAWSDTCCINKVDYSVLQEALVSMFQWYERSAMTIVFLRGVGRLAGRGALTRSIWNMRAWTLLEYHASKVVRIFTEDWTPYLGLEIYNHKESPEIISEMEEATGISAQALTTLRPGLDDIREKLRLFSTRQTTRVEDAAYSLLGIFSLRLPITYGERDGALGRLLSELLSRSGDTSILAWTGRSCRFNSCLPSSITVFSQPPTSHIPHSICSAEISAITTGIHSLDHDLLTVLYNRLNGLPMPSFSGRRMRLPCLAFQVRRVSVSGYGSERVFRAQTTALGIVEIRTDGDDFSQMDSLYLVYPWIDFLLDRLPARSALTPTGQTRTGNLTSLWIPPFDGRSGVPDDASLSSLQQERRVLEFFARLGRPFGALLFAPSRRNMVEYSRVATDSLITVQVQKITPEILEELIESVRVLDVL